MLTELDHIVIAARYRRPVVDALRAFLGAEVMGADHLPIGSAQRTTLRAGTSEIEVLEPRGVGAPADFIGRRGPGLFAVGLASPAVEEFRAQLEAQRVLFEEHRLGEGLATRRDPAPWGSDTPIARFFFRRGPGIYGVSALSDQLAAIRERLVSLGRAAPARSPGEPLLVPSQLLDGARLAVFDRAGGMLELGRLVSVFDAQAAWA